MPHTLSPEQLHTELSPEALEYERRNFTQELISAGLMSQEFADSGDLERFFIDKETGIDHMKHILVGDITGGCHHLRSVYELGLDDRVIASEIHDPKRPDREIKSFKEEQKVNSKNIYGANVIKIIDSGIAYGKEATIERDGEKIEIATGSTMFPDEWTAEQVLKAVLEVADTTARKEGKPQGKRKTLEHDATVDDIRIKVITDEETGQIRTAAPVHRGRYFG